MVLHKRPNIGTRGFRLSFQLDLGLLKSFMAFRIHLELWDKTQCLFEKTFDAFVVCTELQDNDGLDLTT